MRLADARQPSSLPLHAAKKPLITGGFKSARRGAIVEGWPLVGFATGAASGIDVLDIDPSGLDWYNANFDALPQTRAHSTRRGLHLLFRHAPGLRNSAGRIAPGIDIRADGGFAIYWPREGLAVEPWPVCDWPEWLLREAMGERGVTRSDAVASNRFLSTSKIIFHVVHGVDGQGWTAALFKLDPKCWGEYGRWFQLMMAAKAAGVSVEDWVKWCVGDPLYANDRDEIARLWQGAPARHYGTLARALKEAGIRVDGRGRNKDTDDREERPKEHVGPKARLKAHGLHHPNIKPRLDGIVRKVERVPTEAMLFWAACAMAELIAESGLKPAVAMTLLKQAAKQSGLVDVLGKDGVRRTIANGFRWVEEKLLESEQCTTPYLAEKENEDVC